MKMAIGRHLVVRQRRQFDKRAGVFVPRLFRAGDRDFIDYTVSKSVGWDLVQEKGVWFTPAKWFTPPSAAPDQEWAKDYHKACEELDKTPAGKKAEELLMSYLTPEQEKTARLYRYIDFYLLHKKSVEDKMAKGKRPLMRTAVFRFLRGYPNGNIKLGFMIDGQVEWLYTICYHPITPYPIDDIVLAQIMALLSDGDTLIREGNVTDSRLGTPWDFKYLYEPEKEPPKLVMPYLRRSREHIIDDLIRDLDKIVPQWRGMSKAHSQETELAS